MPKYTFFLTLFIFSISMIVKGQNQPSAIKGVLDLREWDFEEKGYFELNGEWNFYYGAFLDNHGFDTLQNPLYQDNPNTWNNLIWRGEPLTGHGFASYRLIVILPHNEHRLMLRSLDQATAFSVLINDKLLAESGQVGTSAENMIPKATLMHEGFETNSDTLRIVIHVSNFFHRRGGLWHALQLGKEKEILRHRNSLLSVDLFLCGALVIMGFYHLLIYLMRSNDTSSFYFALLCFTVPLRILTTGEKYITEIFPDISWLLKTRLEYISIYLILSFIAAFFNAIFPEEFKKRHALVFFYLGWLFTAITLVVDANVFTYFVIPYYILIGIAIVYATFALFKAIYRRKTGSIVFMIGTLILCCTVVNDILHNNLIIRTGYFTPLGFIIFFFSQATILALNSNRAFKKVESLSNALKESNETLKNRVFKRTEELENVNRDMQQLVNTLNEALESGELQKKVLEEQNKDIKASITYAKRIQEAMLPQYKEISSVLPDSFILYKPKDIVSGDFYWFAEKKYKIILAAADCTGHGIPGAFMSMICINLLNEIVNVKNIHEADKILNELRISIRKALKQEENNNQDGLDISVCTIDRYNEDIIEVLGTPKVEFAGVGNPLVLFRQGNQEIIKADKMIIGGFKNYIEENDFTKHSFEIPQNGDRMSFYIFSDGFQDQFGGERIRKYSTRKFYELLQEIQQYDMPTQKEILDQTLENWMIEGDQAQVDDILVLGFKL